MQLKTQNVSFPALFRLVKLWAQAHECNDASQSTLNSTALTCLCVFFLQRLGVLPPLRALCEPRLAEGGARLLDARLRHLWVDEGALDLLVAAVDARAAEINAAKRRHRRGDGAEGEHAAHAAAAAAAEGLQVSQLFAGFLAFWERPFAAWAAGRLRDWRPDCWDARGKRARHAKAYLCPLEDPFDADDNPARAVGSEAVPAGRQDIYIAAALGTGAAALRRVLGDAPQGEARRAPRDAALRVLRALAWTWGLRGLRLLRPPLPAHQLAVLEAAAARGAAAGGVNGPGSAHEALLEHLGEEVADEDVLDHHCWRRLLALQRERQRQETMQRAREMAQRRQEAQPAAKAAAARDEAPLEAAFGGLAIASAGSTQQQQQQEQQEQEQDEEQQQEDQQQQREPRSRPGRRRGARKPRQEQQQGQPPPPPPPPRPAQQQQHQQRQGGSSQQQAAGDAEAARAAPRRRYHAVRRQAQPAN